MVRAVARPSLERLVSTLTTSGRVLLTTVFGDALLPRGQAISVVDLALLVAPLGINERAVRTSLLRLSRDGVVTSERVGRHSLYRVDDSAIETFERADERIYRRTHAEWDGQWTLAALEPGADAAARTRFQRELGWLGVAAIAPGTYASPTVTPDEMRTVAERLDAPLAALVRGRLEAGTLDGDPTLVAFADPTGELHALHEQHLERWSTAPVGGADDAQAFALRTLVLDEWRRIALRTVAVPDALLPDQWLGDAARHVTIDRYDEVFEASERHLDRVVGESSVPARPFADR